MVERCGLRGEFSMFMMCNQAAIQLIQSFESCRLESYEDEGGVWTIGWGATGHDIIEGLVWTQEQANERFVDDLLVKAETPVNSLVKVDLTPNQFSALCAFCFNVGSGHFAKSSALALLNQGNYDDVPAHLSLWDEVDGVPSKGLIRRRAAECALWETA